MAPKIDIYFFYLIIFFTLIAFNMLLIITYILKIYYNSGVTYLLAHNELFIEKKHTKISVYPS